MKGYIYPMFRGADPSIGWEMTDPIYKGIPTMGACRTDIRRVIERGDFVFSISGNVVNVRPHIVGAFEVDEKIHGIAAYKQFPQNRMKVNEEGKLQGNIICDEKGEHLGIDYHPHDTFDQRIQNFIIGKNPIFFDKKTEMEKAKAETLRVLNYIFNRNEDKVSKIIGRWRKMDESQVKDLLDWMHKIKE